MNRDDLLARLQGFEWNDFECKKASRGVPDDAYKTVAAFANTAGSWLVFGVSEHNGQLEITGVDEPDRVQNDFLSTLRSGQKLNQIIRVEEQRYSIDGKTVFAFHVPESPRETQFQAPDALRVRFAAAAERATERVTGEVTGEVRRLLAVMSSDMKRAEIQLALGLKHADHFREAYLLPALAANVIAMTQPDKPRSSKQRYRLTERGTAVLAGQPQKETAQ